MSRSRQIASSLHVFPAQSMQQPHRRALRSNNMHFDCGCTTTTIATTHGLPTQFAHAGCPKKMSSKVQMADFLHIKRWLQHSSMIHLSFPLQIQKCARNQTHIIQVTNDFRYTCLQDPNHSLASHVHQIIHRRCMFALVCSGYRRQFQRPNPRAELQTRST